MNVVQFCLIVLTVIQVPHLNAKDSQLLLTKSLGYSAPNLADNKLNREYMDLYEEMIKVSHESTDQFNESEEKKLETVVGKERLELMKKGVWERRRSATQLYSPFGRRRARSQESRRQKLNSQGLKSHQRHARQGLESRLSVKL